MCLVVPDDQKVTIPSEDSDEGILGALSEAVANFVAWISGSDDDDTVGLENLQQLEQKITFKKNVEPSKIPANEEIGIGPSKNNQLYIKTPTDKVCHRFRQCTQNSLI